MVSRYCRALALLAALALTLSLGPTAHASPLPSEAGWIGLRALLAQIWVWAEGAQPLEREIFTKEGPSLDPHGQPRPSPPDAAYEGPSPDPHG